MDGFKPGSLLYVPAQCVRFANAGTRRTSRLYYPSSLNYQSLSIAAHARLCESRVLVYSRCVLPVCIRKQIASSNN